MRFAQTAGMYRRKSDRERDRGQAPDKREQQQQACGHALHTDK
jgi:hypothetical protein